LGDVQSPQLNGGDSSQNRLGVTHNGKVAPFPTNRKRQKLIPGGVGGGDFSLLQYWRSLRTTFRGDNALF